MDQPVIAGAWHCFPERCRRAARALVHGKAPGLGSDHAPAPAGGPTGAFRAWRQGFRRPTSKTLRAAHGFRGSGGVMRFAVAFGLVLAFASGTASAVPRAIPAHHGRLS